MKRVGRHDSPFVQRGGMWGVANWKHSPRSEAGTWLKSTTQRATTGAFFAANHAAYAISGDKAKLGRVWPHMLRHSCGYYLGDRGTDLRTMQDYLGHRDPKHTAHYTRVAGHRFEGLWK